MKKMFFGLLSVGLLSAFLGFVSIVQAVPYAHYVDGNELVDGQIYVKDKGTVKKSLTVTGAHLRGIVSATSAVSPLEATHNTVLCNGALTVSLPAVSGNSGLSFLIVNVGTQTVTIDPNASESLNGTSTSATMTTQYDWREIITNGSEWFFVGKNP